MDKIIIEDLNVEAFIGIYQHEKENKQPLFITLELSVNLSKPALSDNINDTIDYDNVVSDVKSVLESKHFELIESAAMEIMRTLFKHHNCATIKIIINKPNAIADAVKTCIKMKRSRKEIKC